MCDIFNDASQRLSSLIYRNECCGGANCAVALHAVSDNLYSQHFISILLILLIIDCQETNESVKAGAPWEALGEYKPQTIKANGPYFGRSGIAWQFCVGTFQTDSKAMIEKHIKRWTGARFAHWPSVAHCYNLGSGV